MSELEANNTVLSQTVVELEQTVGQLETNLNASETTVQQLEQLLAAAIANITVLRNNIVPQCIGGK